MQILDQHGFSSGLRLRSGSSMRHSEGPECERDEELPAPGRRCAARNVPDLDALIAGGRENHQPAAFQTRKELAPTVEPYEQRWAHEELVSRIEAIRSRMRPEDLLPESSPLVDAQRDLFDEWLRDWRSREALRNTFR